VTRVDHRNMTGSLLSTKNFKLIGIVNQWLGYADCSQKYDRTPSFCETLQVHLYCESVNRLRVLITEIRQNAFLSATPLNFVGIVNHWQGDAD
jgi:hypothetical protein